MKLIVYLFLILISSCQFSRKEPVVPTILTFTLAPPAVSTYIAGQNLDFSLSFPKEVVVTGLPRLTLTVGSTTRYADYISGSGSQTLLFRYTVVMADDDSDGIVLASTIDLHSGTLKYDTTLDCHLDFNSALNGVKIDNLAPALNSITPVTANGTYYFANHLVFTATFNKAVVVTGTPRIAINVGVSTVYANYTSGTGTNTLTFDYQIGLDAVDTDGITLASPLSLNSGTINDSLNRTSTLTFTPPLTSGLLVHGDVPLVSSVTLPANKTYIETENIDLTLLFSHNVAVTGTPRIAITVGIQTRSATYLSGSGTNTLIFRYTVPLNDFDSDGITAASLFTFAGGESIRSSSLGVDARNTFVVPNSSGIKVDAAGPQIISVAKPANGNYKVGDVFSFVATYDELVNVTGSPSLPVEIGSTTVQATYTSGTGTANLTFRYTLQEGDADSDGIEVTPLISLNGGLLKGADLNSADLDFSALVTTGVIVDAVSPFIVSVAAPPNGYYKKNANMDFIVNMSEAVNVTSNVKMELTIGTTTVFANYFSGSGTASLTFRYSVTATDLDTDGIAVTSPLQLDMTGKIEDLVGNPSSYTFTAPTTTAVLVDGVVPTITSVTAPINKTYITGDNIDFTVNFSENVDKIGAPRIALTVGTTPVYANYFSGAGSNSWVFRYSVTAGLVDSDGVVLTSPLELNAGMIQDIAGNDTSLPFTLPVTTGILVDSKLPTITSITLPASTTYIENTDLNFTVNWDENVVVTGTPQIELTVGTTTLYANYVSGSTTSALLFRYTVSAASSTGDEDLDGIVMTSPLSLNSGTIRDAATNAATLTYVVPATTGIKVDAKNPTITSITRPVDGFYNSSTNANLDIIVTYHEPVTVVAGPYISLDIGSTIGGANRSASYLSGSGTNSLTFRYIVTAKEFDIDGITNSDINFGVGSISDSTSHAAATSLGILSLSAVRVTFPGLVGWYDASDTSTLNCSTNACAVTSMADKGPAGNNLSLGAAGVTYSTSGYGSRSTPYLKYNNAGYLNFPAVSSAQYFIFVMKSDSSATTSNDVIGGSTVLIQHKYASSVRSLTLSSAGQYKSNGSAPSASSTSFAGAWEASTNYIQMMRFSTGQSLSGQRLGSATFDGQFAEVFIYNTSSGILADPELSKINAYLNAKHGAY